MISPQEKQDKVIRSTDLDALSCRYSANNKSYFSTPDPFIDSLISSYKIHLPLCTGYTSMSANRTLRSVFNEQKLPLINRGTYLRTELIDVITQEFIKEFKKCQIISLGGGSDTRCFRILEQYDEEVKYCEIDFPESVKIKKLAILNDRRLAGIVKYDKTTQSITSKEEFARLEANIHTDNYHLIGYDLRQLTSILGCSLLEHVDTSIPTLILSECVLCYLNPEENKRIIDFWKNAFASRALLALLIYEPMSLNDAFGTTMTHNLSNRGINLLTFNEYPNLDARYKLLSEKCQSTNIKLTDMSNVGGYDSDDNSKAWISNKDLDRINRLELVDEIEEIRLLLKHYCLCYCEFPYKSSFKAINKWKWIIE